MKKHEARRRARALVADTIDGLLQAGWPRDVESVSELEEDDALDLIEEIDAIVARLRPAPAPRLDWHVRGDGYQWTPGILHYVVYNEPRGWVAMAYTDTGKVKLADRKLSWQAARKVCEEHHAGCGDVR